MAPAKAMSCARQSSTPRLTFYKTWATACIKAGLFRVVQIDGQAVKVPTMLTHDFRRTAVRNMERTGAPRSVATKLTGHRTEAVCRRYAIVSDADLHASAKLAGTITGTVTATGTKVRGIN